MNNNEFETYAKALEAIQRVRELANHWLTGQSDEIPYDAGQFATALLKALDGEQIKGERFEVVYLDEQIRIDGEQ